MAHSEQQICITMEAGQDLSAKQYYIVKLASDGQIDPAGAANTQSEGVLQNDPAAAGREASVCVSGVTKCVAAEAISVGDSIATDTAGKAVVAVTGEFILGKAITAAGADGDIFTMLFQPHGIKA
jgi:hypothetical protein